MNKSSSRQPVPWKFMLPLILSTMMNPLNSTMLATALVTLCNSFKISIGDGAILIASLYVTATIAQPLMGRLADIYNPKKINVIGLYLVLLATAVGVAAPNLGWLIVSRVILGIGTSAAYPSAMAIINRRYADEQTAVPGNVLGIVAISSQVSMILGPSLGGFLSQIFGWRGILFINIPWVLISLLLFRNIDDFPSLRTKKDNKAATKMDLVGVLLFTSFLLTSLYVLTGHDYILVATVVAFLKLLGLIFWEWHHRSPFIDFRLLVRKPELSLVYVRTLATNYILYLLLNAVPQWIQVVKKIDPAHSGLIMLPMTITAIAVGLFTARVNKPVFQNVVGVAIMLIACLCTLLFNAAMSMSMIIAGLVIVGCADGINMIANQSLLNQEAPSEQKGVSFGLYRTAGYIGAIISGSQLKIVFIHGVTDTAFHRLGYFALISAFILIILLIPLFMMKKNAVIEMPAR